MRGLSESTDCRLWRGLEMSEWSLSGTVSLIEFNFASSSKSDPIVRSASDSIILLKEWFCRSTGVGWLGRAG